MLRFRQVQVDALIHQRRATKTARIAAFLKRRLPDLLGDQTDADLAAFVDAWVPSARQLRLTSERGEARWCMLQLLTQGEAAQDPDIVSLLSSAVDPERTIKELLQQTSSALGDIADPADPFRWR